MSNGFKTFSTEYTLAAPQLLEIWSVNSMAELFELHVPLKVGALIL
jgi:hypothetical protein